MTWRRRLRSVPVVLAKALIVLTALVLVIVGIVVVAVETPWAKNRLRDLIIYEANKYLTATLSIGRLGGSLLRGIELGDIRLSRDGRTLVSVDEIALDYSIRELLQPGLVIHRVRLTRLHVAGRKMPDGRWDLGALVKREARQEERSGPGRAFGVDSIEIIDGRVSFEDPIELGAAHLPTDFQSINAKLSFSYRPVQWRLVFNEISWKGHAPELSVTRLTGTLGNGPGGWLFDNLAVSTPRSAFLFTGRIHRDGQPTELDLRVRADRFDFQEWSGVIHGLEKIAVSSSFDVTLVGPLTKLRTTLHLTGTGGGVSGNLVLDTTVPGWHGAGTVQVDHLDLARWLDRPDRPSDITGRVTFNLALELGRHFPQGSYVFEGPHASFMGYAGENLTAKGHISSTEVVIASVAGTAYGSKVHAHDSSIGIGAPFPFRFQGTIEGLDLRRLPDTIPVPRVDSVLAFDYDTSGRFADPVITARATFAQSEFLGATLRSGLIGTFDTSQKPLSYSGDGTVDGMNLARLGDGLDVAWLRDPRYRGSVSGRFRVDGSGSDRAALTLTARGRVSHADLFSGALTDADVSLDIEQGTLSASYSGQLTHVNPAVPLADSRFESSLTGSLTMATRVKDLITSATTTLSDYDVSGAMSLSASTIRGFHVDDATVQASLGDSILDISSIKARSSAFDGQGAGQLALVEGQESAFEYEVTRADLAQLKDLIGQDLEGQLSTKGNLTGARTEPHVKGSATIAELRAFGVNALTISSEYDATLPESGLSRVRGHATGQGSSFIVQGSPVQEASWNVSLDESRLAGDVQITRAGNIRGEVAGLVVLHPEEHRVSIGDLTITLGRAPWRLVGTRGSQGSQGQLPTISWDRGGFAVDLLELVDGNADERLAVDGNWRRDGSGSMHVTANHVFLETLQTAFERPTRYGGSLDLDATIRGTQDHPLVTSTVAITNGRVERVTYQKLAGRLDYGDELFSTDLRLDQGPGVWLTATGRVPLALFDKQRTARPIDLAVKSSVVNLGLLEGATDVVRNVSGTIQMDVSVVGTSHDPQFTGSVEIANAAFLVAASGSRYERGRADITLARDRVTVESLHVEDTGHHALDLHGSLGTVALRVGDVEIEANTKGFELLRNELGRLDVNAALQLRGRLDAPRVNGDVTISSGNLKVDEILARTVARPYRTDPTPTTQVDAVLALNPWDLMDLDISLHVPNSLRLTGSDLQAGSASPVGLGDINLRVAGDLYLVKEPAEELSVTGSLDSVSGSYMFQGRRFDVDEASSIDFRGDLNPGIDLIVTRLISGVEVRVTVAGTLQQPELRLSSVPPLDPSDVLSLIAFGTSANQLSAPQQQDLLVRAGALAAGFVATPVLSAIENRLGLSSLDIEPTGDFGTGPKLTVGEELAPGLLAQFTRQFGSEPYDVATVEYYLSRLFRLRATFSDAQSLIAMSPFRRIERAGIDLLLFFSF